MELSCCVVASKNPVKLAVAKRAVSLVYPSSTWNIEAVDAPSSVAAQPWEEETRQGAHNRLAYVCKLVPKGTVYLSQEAGLFRDGVRVFNQAWIVAADAQGFVAEATTARYYLPKDLAARIEEGVELGEATDEFFATKNTKHGLGAIGYLTDGLLSREDYYLQAAIIALSELKHKAWYQ